MADQNTLVKAVIAVLHDGEKGFPDIGEHLKNPEGKTFFMQEGKTRGEFARELEAALGTSGSDDVGGTAAGAVHRVWGDVKASLGGGDHTLLETAEQGEDAAKKVYQEALAGGLQSSSLQSILSRQQQHILQSHNKVKAMRDSLAS